MIAVPFSTSLSLGEVSQEAPPPTDALHHELRRRASQYVVQHVAVERRAACARPRAEERQSWQSIRAVGCWVGSSVVATQRFCAPAGLVAHSNRSAEGASLVGPLSASLANLRSVRRLMRPPIIAVPGGMQHGVA